MSSRTFVVAALRALGDRVDSVGDSFAAGLRPALASGLAGAASGAHRSSSQRARGIAMAAAAQPVDPAHPIDPSQRSAAGPSSPPDASGSAVLHRSGSSAAAVDREAVEREHTEVWHLVMRAQAGDGEAFGELYDRYVDTVYRFISVRVPDRALAEDFTSETFLRALRGIGSISYRGRDIGAWLITIARNIIFDHAKSARHRFEVTLPDFLDRDESVPGPESAVLDSFRTTTLVEAIGRLNSEQRECIILRFVHGLSVTETAAAMDKNDGAVKALQHRAVRKLADLVGDTLR